MISHSCGVFEESVKSVEMESTNFFQGFLLEMIIAQVVAPTPQQPLDDHECHRDEIKENEGATGDYAE